MINFASTVASCPVCHDDIFLHVEGKLKEISMYCSKPETDEDHYWIGLGAFGDFVCEEITDGKIRVFSSMRSKDVSIAKYDEEFGRYTYLTFIKVKDASELLPYRTYDETWSTRMEALIDYQQEP